MIVEYTGPFVRFFRDLPTEIQRLFEKKLRLLIESGLSHPSLRIKRMQGHPSIWEGSITMHYRFTFEKIKGGIRLRKIGTHDLLKRP